MKVTVNGSTLTLTSPVNLPSGDGPFPAVIGIFGPTGSLPSSIFTKRNIATIGFDFRQVMAHTQTRGREPIIPDPKLSPVAPSAAISVASSNHSEPSYR